MTDGQETRQTHLLMAVAVSKHRCPVCMGGLALGWTEEPLGIGNGADPGLELVDLTHVDLHAGGCAGGQQASGQEGKDDLFHGVPLFL